MEFTGQDPAEEYEDLDKYGPVRWNEPDGLQRKTPEELSKNYEDLHMYGAVTWQEPDGLRRLTPEEESKFYKDLPLYSAPEATGPEVVPTRIHPEEASKAYKDLPEYGRFDNSGPEAPRVHPEEASKEYEDLGLYRAFPNSGPPTERVHPEQASKRYNDLGSYPRSGFEEPTQTTHIHPEELTKNYQDLDDYKPSKFDSFDTRYPTHPEETTKAYKDLDAYGAIRHEPDGLPQQRPDAVSAGLKSYDDKNKSQLDRSAASNVHRRKEGVKGDDPIDSLTAEEIRANVHRKAQTNSTWSGLERSKVEHEAKWDSALQDARLELKKGTRAKPSGRTLTGNYARDFLEDFTMTWNMLDSPTAALFPKTKLGEAMARLQREEQEEVGVSSMDESFPVEVPNPKGVQTALSRGGFRRSTCGPMTAQFLRDPYAKAPKGLETSFAEECASDLKGPTLVRHYKAETDSVRVEDPVIFKILAYDPVAGTISVATTTSGLSNTKKMMSAAEILLGLSHPSKFFPHFKAIQAEGFEIVAGTGNVLVFRQSPNPSKAATVTFTKVLPAVTTSSPQPLKGSYPASFASQEHERPLRSESSSYPELISRRANRERRRRNFGRKLILTSAGLVAVVYGVGTLAERISMSGF